QPRDIVVDTSGRGSLSNVIAVPLMVTLQAANYEVTEQRFETIRSNQALRVVARRGQTVSGIVQDKVTGQPIAGATIRLLGEKGPGGGRSFGLDNAEYVMGQSDASGRFILSRLRSNAKFWLAVSAPGRESVILPEALPGQSN